MLLWFFVLANLAQPASDAKPATPAVAPVATPVEGYSSADELLTALERADEGLDTLQADLRHDVLDDLAGDRQVRYGQLFFERVPAAESGDRPVRRFAAKFTRINSAGSQRDEVRIHAFDGRWYADKLVDEKRISRREVVAPGDTFDPLKLGEGPLPVPIGQKKADILERYNVELLPAQSGLSATEPALLTFVEGTVQLRLTPKNAGNDNYKEIRLWYRGKRPDAMGPGDKASDRLLPRLARTEGSTADPKATGNVTIIQLVNIAVNGDAKIDAEVMSTAAPAGWDVTETPLRKALPVVPPTPAASPAAAPATPGSEPAPAPPVEPKKDESPR